MGQAENLEAEARNEEEQSDHWEAVGIVAVLTGLSAIVISGGIGAAIADSWRGCKEGALAGTLVSLVGSIVVVAIQLKNPLPWASLWPYTKSLLGLCLGGAACSVIVGFGTGELGQAIQGDVLSATDRAIIGALAGPLILCGIPVLWQVAFDPDARKEFLIQVPCTVLVAAALFTLPCIPVVAVAAMLEPFRSAHYMSTLFLNGLIIGIVLSLSWPRTWERSWDHARWKRLELSSIAIASMIGGVALGLAGVAGSVLRPHDFVLTHTLGMSLLQTTIWCAIVGSLSGALLYYSLRNSHRGRRTLCAGLILGGAMGPVSFNGHASASGQFNAEAWQETVLHVTAAAVLYALPLTVLVHFLSLLMGVPRTRSVLASLLGPLNGALGTCVLLSGVIGGLLGMVVEHGDYIGLVQGLGALVGAICSFCLMERLGGTFFHLGALSTAGAVIFTWVWWISRGSSGIYLAGLIGWICPLLPMSVGMSLKCKMKMVKE